VNSHHKALTKQFEMSVFGFLRDNVGARSWPNPGLRQAMNSSSRMAALDCGYRSSQVVVRALSIRISRHACDQAGPETGSVSQDHYHFGGPRSWFCRRSESLTNLKTPLTLNHQHRQTRHRKRRGSSQDLAGPAVVRYFRSISNFFVFNWLRE